MDVVKQNQEGLGAQGGQNAGGTSKQPLLCVLYGWEARVWEISISFPLSSQHPS